MHSRVAERICVSPPAASSSSATLSPTYESDLVPGIRWIPAIQVSDTHAPVKQLLRSLLASRQSGKDTSAFSAWLFHQRVTAFCFLLITPYCSMCFLVITPYCSMCFLVITPYRSVCLLLITPYCTMCFLLITPYRSVCFLLISPYCSMCVLLFKL